MDLSPEGSEPLRIGDASGQLTLDKLLASLALENDVTEQHLAKIDQQVGERNHVTELSAVIADLAEYDLSEAQRLNLYNGNDLGAYHNTDAFRTHADLNGNGCLGAFMNGRNGGGNEPNGGSSILISNHHVRRIASESDSTISSISPSLSERSNAISWCDQVTQLPFFSPSSADAAASRRRSCIIIF